MQTEQQLIKKFQDDASEIARAFISAYGLLHTEQETSLSDPMLRWVEFVHRYISPEPRNIVHSSRFPTAENSAYSSALELITNKIRSGEDVNPYQSKGLTLHNDVSGRKRQSRTDMLWADWGIHHLHLTDQAIPIGQYFSGRSQWLLFCILTDDSAKLIDIRNHSEEHLFEDNELIQIVATSWPDLIERYRFNGVMAPAVPYTPEEIKELRRGGVTPILTLNNSAYVPPGMGLTTASTPLKATLAMDRIRQSVSDLARLVYDNNSQFKSHAFSSGNQDPEYSIAATERGIAVYEEKQNHAFVLPRGPASFLGQLHDLLAPAWSIAILDRNSAT